MPVRRQILVVDDAEGIRTYLKNLLSLKGYDVLLAPDGATALEYLQGGASPEVAILDIMMPGMDGLGNKPKLFPLRLLIIQRLLEISEMASKSINFLSDIQPLHFCGAFAGGLLERDLSSRTSGRRGAFVRSSRYSCHRRCDVSLVS